MRLDPIERFVTVTLSGDVRIRIMEEAQTLVRVVSVFAAVQALAWGCIGLLMRIARKAAFSFSLANILLLIGVLLTLRRVTDMGYLSFQLADLIILGSFLWFRVGLQKLTSIPVTKREHGFVFFLTGLAELAISPTPESVGAIATIFSAGAAWVTFRSFREAQGSLSGDFNFVVRLFFSLPFLLVCLTLVARPVFALLVPAEASRLNDIYGAGGASFLWVQLVLLMLINMSLGGIAIGGMFLKIRELAERDVLTGLWNRRAIEARIRAERERFRRTGQGCALAVFDLDFFKKVNDELGHDGGDAALKHVAEVISKSLRKMDALGRFGGEEFLVVMPMTDLAGAQVTAERMRKSLEATPLIWREKPLKITASIGLAAMTVTDGNDGELFKRADEALYRAKAGGRNRVELELDKVIVGALH